MANHFLQLNDIILFGSPKSQNRLQENFCQLQQSNLMPEILVLSLTPDLRFDNQRELLPVESNLKNYIIYFPL